MKFKHLKVPDHWEHYFTRYPQGYTILEALIEWVSQVDALADNVNDWNEYLDDFVENFDKKIEPTIINVLYSMADDGTLDRIINEAIFADINSNVTSRAINVQYPFGTDLDPVIPDGVNDDTPKLLAIIEYATQEGLDVFIPNGDYRCNLSLEGWGVNLVGANPTKTILRPYNTAVPVIRDNGTMRRNAYIKNIKLQGSGLAGEIGVEITRNSYLCLYENIVIENFDIAVHAKYSWGFYFDMF